MRAREIRAQAREALSGNWTTFILLNVMYVLAISVLTFINYFIPFLGAIAYILLIVPLTYSYSQNLLRLKRKETDNAFEFFKEIFANFKRSWSVVGRTIQKVLIPCIVAVVALIIFYISLTSVVISAIFGGGSIIAVLYVVAFISLFISIIAYIVLFVRGLLYMLSTYIAIDNPQMTAKESVDTSAKLMNGNRWKYICLSLSFLGWMILSIITFGFGYIFLLPYMSVAYVCFYEALAGKKQSNSASNDSDTVEVSQEPVVEANNENEQKNVVLDTFTVNDNNDNDNPIKQ